MTLKIEYRPLKSLVPYSRNARTHPRHQVQKLKASLAEYGWANPMLVADGQMIAGHGRLIAALEMAEQGVVIPRNPDAWSGPTVDLSHLSATQRKAYVLMDNKSALDSGWDTDLLLMELGDLHEEIDLSLTGFNEDELAALLGGAGPQADENAAGEDEVSAPPAIPVTVPGDIWIMGRHRLMCGDSTNPQHIERLMQGELADFCFTSPPYGKQRKYELEEGISDWDALMQGVFGLLPLTPDAQVLVNLGLVHKEGECISYWDGWIEWMRAAGWRRFGWYVWDQGWGMQGDWQGRLAPSHEWVFHFNRHAGEVNRTVPKKPENIKDKTGIKNYRKGDGSNGMNSVNASPKSALHTHKIPDSVIRVTRHTGGLGDAGAHPAVFPVDLVSEMLTAFTKPDQIVYEPFSGSGTTLISAQKNGRSARAMEIAPAYVDVAIRRWSKFAGQFATLEGDGRSFDEIEQDRRA
jgi:DNA modification methylase